MQITAVDRTNDRRLGASQAPFPAIAKARAWSTIIRAGRIGNYRVSDDGVGTLQTLADAKAGLGTGIVEALANQLDATVKTEC